MSMSMSKLLRAIPSRSIRTCIRKEARRLGFIMGRIGRANKEILADAIFAVENEREHRKGPYDPIVCAMRAVRNQICDALGWNETTPASARSSAE